MICPKCGYEYVEGYTVCNDCGVPLVEKKNKLPEKKEYIAMKPVLLAEVSDDFEANIICQALELEGIKALVKERETGSIMRIYTGSSNYLKSIYVDHKDEKMARNIIENIQAGKTSEDASEDASEHTGADQPEGSGEQQKFRWGLAFFVIYIFFVLLGIVFSIITF